MMMLMKLLILLSIIDLAEGNRPTCAFVERRQQHVLFGIRGGARISRYEFFYYFGDDDNDYDDDSQENDYDKAENAIFSGIAKIEERVQKAVEEEVHSIFDADDHDHSHKEKVVEHAKTAVKRGTQKVKDNAATHSKFHDFFLPKHHEDNPHDDHRILHALEAAETAVLHAVEEEVDTLFHPTHDEHIPNQKAAHESVKKGVQKAKKDTKEEHKQRRKWMGDFDSEAIDEYLKSVGSMYGLGY